jgi:hypothetical protein
MSTAWPIVIASTAGVMSGAAINLLTRDPGHPADD